MAAGHWDEEGNERSEKQSMRSVLVGIDRLYFSTTNAMCLFLTLFFHSPSSLVKLANTKSSCGSVSENFHVSCSTTRPCLSPSPLLLSHWRSQAQLVEANALPLTHYILSPLPYPLPPPPLGRGHVPCDEAERVPPLLPSSLSPIFKNI